MELYCCGYCQPPPLPQPPFFSLSKSQRLQIICQSIYANCKFSKHSTVDEQRVWYDWSRKVWYHMGVEACQISQTKIGKMMMAEVLEKRLTFHNYNFFQATAGINRSEILQQLQQFYRIDEFFTDESSHIIGLCDQLGDVKRGIRRSHLSPSLQQYLTRKHLPHVLDSKLCNEEKLVKLFRQAIPDVNEYEIFMDFLMESIFPWLRERDDRGNNNRGNDDRMEK